MNVSAHRIKFVTTSHPKCQSIENSREKNSWPTRDNNRISPILQLQCSIDQPDYKGRSSLTLRTAAGDEVGDMACPRQK